MLCMNVNTILLSGVNFWGRKCENPAQNVVQRRARAVSPSPSVASHAIPASEIYTTEYIIENIVLSQNTFVCLLVLPIFKSSFDFLTACLRQFSVCGRCLYILILVFNAKPEFFARKTGR